MLFLPVAVLADVSGIGWGDVLHSLAFAFVGNLVGGALLVGGACCRLHGREEATPHG